MLDLKVCCWRVFFNIRLLILLLSISARISVVLFGGLLQIAVIGWKNINNNIHLIKPQILKGILNPTNNLNHITGLLTAAPL